MLIDDIDFADLYLQQLKLAHRTEKTPDHWDQRAEKMAENCASPTDSYLQQLISKIDLQGAQTLFDMGCGPGTVSLALADKLTTIYGVDYSQGMLNVAARRAAALKADNVHWIQRAWEEDWSDLPRCDIAVASRSTLVASRLYDSSGQHLVRLSSHSAGGWSGSDRITQLYLCAQRPVSDGNLCPR